METSEGLNTRESTEMPGCLVALSVYLYTLSTLNKSTSKNKGKQLPTTDTVNILVALHMIILFLYSKSRNIKCYSFIIANRQ